MEINGGIKILGNVQLTPSSTPPEDAGIGTVWLTEEGNLRVCTDVQGGVPAWKDISLDIDGDLNPQGNWDFKNAVLSYGGFVAANGEVSAISMMAENLSLSWYRGGALHNLKIDDALAVATDWTLPLSGGQLALASEIPKSPYEYTLSDTTGTVAADATNVVYTPEANSTAVIYASRDQLHFNTNRQLTTGGWLSAHQSVVNAGAGTVDKIVVDFAQANLDGNVQVNTLLMYEVSISRINAAANANGAVGFYFPNLRAVTNIGRIGTLAAFVNDDPKAFSRTQGPFYNRTLQEFTPPYHPGLVPGRYYSAPYRLIGDSTITANYAACVPVFVPHTTTISELGFIVSTGVASSQAVMAIYTAEKGKVQNLVWQSTAAISTATAGNKTQAPNVEVAPGTYWLLLLTSVNLSIKYHQPQSSDLRMCMLGQPAADTQDNNLNRIAYLPLGGFAVNSFPAQLATVPSFLNQDGEPHVWFRVSA